MITYFIDIFKIMSLVGKTSNSLNLFKQLCYSSGDKILLLKEKGVKNFSLAERFPRVMTVKGILQPLV